MLFCIVFQIACRNYFKMFLAYQSTLPNIYFFEVMFGWRWLYGCCSAYRVCIRQVMITLPNVISVYIVRWELHNTWKRHTFKGINWLQCNTETSFLIGTSFFKVILVFLGKIKKSLFDSSVSFCFCISIYFHFASV